MTKTEKKRARSHHQPTWRARSNTTATWRPWNRYHQQPARRQEEFMGSERQNRMRRSFADGFAYGASPGAFELSAREILERLGEADVDVDAYSQGMLDGLAGDTWRLNQ